MSTATDPRTLGDIGTLGEGYPTRSGVRTPVGRSDSSRFRRATPEVSETAKRLSRRGTDAPTLILSADPDLTAIRVREQGSVSWVEFRSTLPYHLWTEERPSHAALLHDTLEGWHSCVLHAGDTLTLLPRHPDYARVLALVEAMDSRT